MAEALLVDQAKADDRVSMMLGLVPTAETDLRAVLAGASLSNPGPAVDDGRRPVADQAVNPITDLADWVARANRAMGGTGDGS